MRIGVIRHPKLQIGSGICYGHLEVAVDPLHLEEVAIHLSAVIPSNQPIYCSCLQRAKKLAVRLQTLRPDLIPAYDERLNEFNFGQWEGVPWDDIPRDAIDSWVNDFSKHRFGGKESTQEMISRVKDLLSDLKGHGEFSLITHAGVYRAIQFIKSNHWEAIVHADQWPRDVIDYGEIQWLEVEVTNRITSKQSV
jgi:alpha-ribazole phosphatase